MFDFTSSKLLLLAIVALLVIGPKDFPALLRTIGKYIGIIRGHAREFRTQFDEAMRESELADLKKEMENIAQETEASLKETERSVQQSVDEARRGVDQSIEVVKAPELGPQPNELSGEPAAGASLPPPKPDEGTAASGNEASQPAEPQSSPSAEQQADQQQVADPARSAEKSGA